MKWVKRGLWLAAWGAWAWLGAALQRELPRRPPGAPAGAVAGAVGGQLFSWTQRDLLACGPIFIAVATVTLQPPGADRVGELEAWRARAGSARTTAETVAVRDRQSGRLLFRLWGMPAAVEAVVLGEPPPVNFPLLALCQAILALPLVLLWAVLRWRRKGRMRLVTI